MSLNSKKQSEHKLPRQKLIHFFRSITRFIFLSEYIRFRVWAIIIPLLLLVLTGNLLTKTGLLVLLIILGYILLSFLHKWLERLEEE